MIPFLLILTTLQPPASQPTGRIAGRVIEARTAAPLAAVLVKLESTGQQAFSDEDGRFEMDAVLAGPQTLLVSVVGYGLVRRDVTVAAGETTDVTIPVAEGASTYVEEVTVGADLFRQAEAAVASQAVLGSRDLLALRGLIADDPFRAAQVLPGVANGDDYSAEFAVRGFGPDHTGIALDGVDSPLLLHTVRAEGAYGSLALINSDILESATLLSGAYPTRAGAHLGSRLDFTTRDGARDRLHGRAMVSATAATTVWEGPLGDGSKGSWLGAFRQSYLDWVLRRIDPGTVSTFGFTDGQARAALDLTSRQTLKVTFIGGRSLYTEHEPGASANALDTSHNRTLIGNAQWRYTPSRTWSVAQQFYVVDGRYKNKTPFGGVRNTGGDRDLTWRGRVEMAPAQGHVFEIGGQAQQFRSERLDRVFLPAPVTVLDVAGSSAAGAAWLHYRWNPSARFLIAPGVRVDRFGSVDAVAASPWLLTEWEVTPGTRLRAGVGARHQGPSFDQLLDPEPGATLMPERASMVDVGLERRIGSDWRVNVGGYYRREEDRLRYEQSEFRVAGGVIVRPTDPFWANTLSGEAYGADVTLERRTTNGLAGWVAYSYGRNELTDSRTHETFVSDFDQTHTLNAYAIYRTSGRLAFSGRYRYGSNFPITGYVQESNGETVLGPNRNTMRLPTYSRLDVRTDWAFTYRRSRLTLFIEVINTLAHDNQRLDGQSLNLNTRRMRNAFESLFPIPAFSGRPD